MSVIIPSHLLEQAEALLVSKNRLGQVRQANRRRAVSNAYYAVFHFILTAAADEFIGRSERRSSPYALAYRSVDHVAIKRLCEEARKPSLTTRYSRYAPSGFVAGIRQFAALVLDLREKRHSADYDPSHTVEMADSRTAIAMAREAMTCFNAADPAQRKVFLALLLFEPRA